MKTVTPVLEVKSRRVGGANYQVPVEVPQRRARTLAVRWIVTYCARPAREADGREARRRDHGRARTSRAARSSGRTTSTGWRRPTRPSRTTAGECRGRRRRQSCARPRPQHRDHGPHRRGQDHDDRADPLLHRPHPQDGRGARGRRDDGLDGAGAGARHHDHVGGDDRVRGATIASTSSIRPGTWTLPSRSSAACASSTARSPSSTPSQASSRSPRPSGARPTATASRASRSSTRWTAPARTSSPPCSRCVDRLGARAGAGAAPDRRGGAPPRRRRPRRDERRRPRTDDLGDEVHGRARSRPSSPSRPHEYHHQLIDAVAEHDDELMETYLERRGARSRPDMLRRALRTATLDRRVHARPLRHRLQEQGRPAAARRGRSTTCRARSTFRRSTASTRARENELSRARVARGAVRRARLQGHVRPVRRQAHVLPRLLRQDQGRRPRAEHDDRQDRARSAASSRCTRTTARSATRSAPARSPPSSASRRRRPATRSPIDTAPIVLESMTFPEPVISVAIEPKTKADQDKLGTGLQRLAEEDPTFRVARRRGDRADAHLRHGRAAPRDHRRPPDARVQGRRERRPPAGRLPRDGRQGRREDRGQVRPPDRRPRPVRPRRDQPRAARAGRGLRVHRQDRRRQDPAASTSRPSTLGIQEAMESGVLAGYPVVDVRVDARRRLATTTSTRARWRSRSPARWPSRTRCSARSRSCSSRSWPSRSSRPRTTSAT